MAVVQIPNLPVAVGIDGREEVEIVQGGTSKRTTTQAIADLGPTFIVQSTIGYFGSFYDTTDQTSSGLTFANVVHFNNTNEVKGVTVFDGSKIKVSETGVYNIQFTARIKSTSVGTDLINIWIAKDGTNVVQTNSPMTILGGSNDVASWNFVLNLSANSYIQVYWSCSTSTNITLEASPTSPDPDKPQTPSASITIQQIGRTDAGWEQPQMAPGQVLGRPAGTTNGHLEEMPFSNPVDYGSFSNVLTSSGTSTTANSWTPLEPYNATLYGAVGDGITDNAAAFTAANAAPSIVITSGSYYIGSNVTFIKEVTMMPGAIIYVPNGVALVFNRGFKAGVYRVFNCSGTGVVQFSDEWMSTGYPEWWGAAANNGSVDNVPYFSACIVALPETILQSADYWFNTTLKIQTEKRRIIGQGWHFTITGSCTRLLVKSASASTIQIGYDTAPPGGINYYLKEVRLSNVHLTRSIAPVAGNASSSLLIKFTLYTFIDNVLAAESSRGYHLTGTVQSHLRQCYAFRSAAGTGGGTDYFWGYYLDGISNLIAAGGNASTYITECTASTGGITLSLSTGLYADGDFADIFVNGFETTSCATGIGFIGGASLNTYGQCDVQINQCILDTFTFAGIYLENIKNTGSITISNGYAAPVFSSTPNACIYFNSSQAQVMISNFQALIAGNATCRGIQAINSKNIESHIQVIEPRNSVIEASGITNCRFMDHATSYAGTGSEGCRFLANCSYNYVQLFTAGVSQAFKNGYNITGTTNTYNEFNCTGVSSNSQLYSDSKIYINGVAITTTGLVGTNLVSGVMN